MKYIQEFIADNLSGFSVADLPNFFFTIFLAAIWAFVLSRLYQRQAGKGHEEVTFSRNLIILAIATTVVVTFIRYSVPLAIAFAALLSLVRFKTAVRDSREMTYLFLVLGMGLGCGAGFGLVASMGYVLIVVLLFLFGKSSN